MRKKILGMMCLLFVIITFIAGGIIIDDYKNDSIKEDKANIDSEGLNVEFKGYSLNEFVKKLKKGDIRSINQDMYSNWEQECKELYCEWYKIGRIPAISLIENNTITSYKYADGMLAICFNKDDDVNKSYYEIITLGSIYDTNDYDIESFYKSVMKKQNDFLERVGGEYKVDTIGDKNIKVACCKYNDGTISVDFIWDKKYWIRMWDDENIILHILNNFSIEEYIIEQPLDFEEDSYVGRITLSDWYESKQYTSIGKLITEISTQTKDEEIRYEDLENNGIPIVASDYNSQVQFTNIITDMMSGEFLIQYSYNIEDIDKNIHVEIYPHYYSEDYMATNFKECVNLLYFNNPYRYNQELADTYGVYNVITKENEQYYRAEKIKINDKDIDVVTFSNDEYDYSEIALIINNRLVKLSCEHENITETLKNLAVNMDIKYIQY